MPGKLPGVNTGGIGPGFFGPVTTGGVGVCSVGLLPGRLPGLIGQVVGVCLPPPPAGVLGPLGMPPGGTGLPPSPDAVRTFLADHSTDAYEKLVDRLLASPQCGARWIGPMVPIWQQEGRCGKCSMEGLRAQPQAATEALTIAKTALGPLMREEQRMILRQLTVWLDELDRVPSANRRKSTE